MLKSCENSLMKTHLRYLGLMIPQPGAFNEISQIVKSHYVLTRGPHKIKKNGPQMIPVVEFIAMIFRNVNLSAIFPYLQYVASPSTGSMNNAPATLWTSNLFLQVAATNFGQSLLEHACRCNIAPKTCC